VTAWAEKHVVVTGGTGSFGRAFVSHLLDGAEPPALVTVFSRDEQKQFEMAADLPEDAYPIRYALGDVRDEVRVNEVTRGAHIIVHAAAMKHVPAAERNPMECVKTNILGSQNVATAALQNAVSRVIALSTDKAASPSGFYGASKLCLEKLFLHADLEGSTRFSVVRFANVFGSKGSVVPAFLRCRASGVLPITHPEMTRFSFTMRGAIDLVTFALTDGWGGEVIVPVVPSYRIVDVALAVAPEAGHRIIGIRPGEKLHELMFSRTDAPRTVRRGAFFVICPAIGRYGCDRYVEATGADRVSDDFEYDSHRNDQWLSVDDLRALLASEAMVA
jgi:UDP-N-acetylglucosamine 4,6-dehydratase/5-epimerase